VHRSEFDATTDLLEKFTLAADNRRRTLKAETIIARPLKYSVSHFIDCHAVARRLHASLIASSKTADQTRKHEHEYRKIQIRNPFTSP
jgi:hypothetical protein